MMTPIFPAVVRRAGTLALALSFLCAAACSASNVQVWLLFSPDFSDAILSNDTNERDNLLKGGWKTSGTGYLSQEPRDGSAPLHRMARSGPKGADRMLETDPARLKKWAQQGFVDEGVIGQAALAAKPGLVPVRHVTKDSRNLWLLSAADQQEAVKAGWKVAPTQIWLWPVETAAKK